MNIDSRQLYFFGWMPVGLCVLALMAGCGGIYDSSVSGVVTLDGQPITRGTVTFNPSTAGPQAYGRINEKGEYMLQTGSEYGLPSGQYRVTVVANEAPSRESLDGGPPPRGKPITPLWYRDANYSGLQFEVAPGSQDIELQLSSNPPPNWNPPKKRRR